MLCFLHLGCCPHNSSQLQLGSDIIYKNYRPNLMSTYTTTCIQSRAYGPVKGGERAWNSHHNYKHGCSLKIHNYSHAMKYNNVDCHGFELKFARRLVDYS